MKFEIDKQIVEPIVREQIAAAITRELGNSEEILTGMIESALKQKVCSNGTISRSSYENKYTFIEVIAGKALRDAAHEALTKTIEEMKPDIERAVRDYLRYAPGETAAAIVGAFIEGIPSKYYFKADFHLKEKND